MNATNTTNAGVDTSLLAMLGAGTQAAETIPSIEGGFVVGVPASAESKPKAASFEELLKTLNLDQTQTSKKSAKEGLVKEQVLVDSSNKKKTSLDGTSKEELTAVQAMMAGQVRVPAQTELVKDLKNESQLKNLVASEELKLLNNGQSQQSLDWMNVGEVIPNISMQGIAGANVKNKAELLSAKNLNGKKENFPKDFLMTGTSPVLADRNIQELISMQGRSNRNSLMNSDVELGSDMGPSMLISDRFMIDSSNRGALLQNSPLISTEDYVFNREALKKSVDGKMFEEPKVMTDFSQTNGQQSANWNMSASLFKPESRVAVGTMGLSKDSLALSGGDGVSASSSAPLQLNNAQALASQVQAIARNGGGVVRVQANPENLGEVTIMVQTKGKRLDIQFETSTQEAREALQNNARQLRDALEAKQFEVAQISVQEKRESSVASNSTQSISTLLGGSGFLESLRENNRSDFQNSGQNLNQNSENWTKGNQDRGQGRGYQESNGNRSKGYQRYLDQYGMSA